ncbi:hypothetical protein CPB84DRAFT_219179 [Gymnopilus junonius]|uniref:Uncharacterized protein n=1 Tax=Gymnopilus junonius TaxID=109634 RepID=A0A9P5NDT2_GYMJU|nr:hypothetical protein CPB84DRAFT_219179 [Gymnopilus junonius]
MWPPLRSQCARVLRRQYVQALSRTPRSAHGATLALRLPHSAVDNAISTSDTKDFPIDVMDKSQALRLLESFLKDGMVGEAKKQLANILASGQSGLDYQLLHNLHEVIVSTNPDKPNLGLIMDLGIAAASMGYRGFAREKSMPFVYQLGTMEIVNIFEQQITSFIEPRPATLTDKQLFEDTDGDYAAAAPIKITPEPSILEIVEQSLPAVLPEAIQGDASIFEDATQEEYFNIVLEKSSQWESHSRHLSVGLLDALIDQNKYGPAYRLLLEMKELDVKIPPKPIFAVICRRIVTENRALTPELVEQLLTWLSLIPSGDRAVFKELETIGGIISDTSFMSIHLQMRISIAFASKGYNYAASTMFNVICHGLRFEQLWDFIQQYEAAYFAFWERTTPERNERKATFIASTRNTVLRILGGTGRHSEIESYLSVDGSYTLWPSTYAHVLLYPISEATKESIVQTLSELKGEKDNAEAVRKVNVRSLEDPIYFGDNLVAGLRYLKRCLHSKSMIPHPHTITSFMDTYLSKGRSKGLHIIFDRALKGNRTIARTIILGEMLFYRRLRHYDLVLETFVNHFYLLGVPHKIVLRRLNDFLQRRQNYDPDSLEERPLQRFYKFEQKAFVGKKMLPLTLHCNIVWDVLVSTDSSSSFVERLYKIFLHGAIERDPQSRQGSRPTDTLDRPMVQPSSFMPFLRPLILLKGPEAGSKIIKDILDLRLQPHQHIYTEVAGAYARKGRVTQAFRIMDQLESRKKYNHEPRVGPAMSVRSPAPDFAFYVAVLKGFVMSRNFEAADKVVEKVESKFDLEPGQNHHYDEALALLKDLKRESLVGFLLFFSFKIYRNLPPYADFLPLSRTFLVETGTYRSHQCKVLSRSLIANLSLYGRSSMTSHLPTLLIGGTVMFA